MKALRFQLSGKTAFFKQPDVNTYVYYTYGCIHRVALLGLFGAVMGYAGYNDQGKKETHPAFYEKLSSLRIAICPQNEKGYVPKKVQAFNNSVGYASRETGGNLIVKEQWLESPKWQIVFLIEDETSEALAQRILNAQATFIPYLGKNDHVANITDPECIDLEPGTFGDTPKIASLFPEVVGNLVKIGGARGAQTKGEAPFKYKERLPMALEPTCNQYLTEAMVYTNQAVNLDKAACAYHLKEENYVFI